jgi:hypothetical protein
VTGVPLGSLEPTFLQAASYEGHSSVASLPLAPFTWSGSLGPNSSLKWSFDYAFTGIAYSGYGCCEFMEGWIGAHVQLLDAPFSYPQYYLQEVFFFHGDNSMEPGPVVKSESGSLGTTIESFPRAIDFDISMRAALVVDGLAVEPTLPVPEPGTWALMLAGVAALVGRVHRARRKP